MADRTSVGAVMRDALEQRVGVGLWAVTAVVFVAFLVVVLPAEAARSQEATGTSESPDTQYRYTPDDLEQLAAAYGEDGRAYYVRSRATFDVVWPLAYGSFLQASLLLASRRTVLRRLPTAVVFVPAFAVVCDLLENTTAAIVMARFPAPAPLAAQAAPVFTWLKWNLLGASFVLVGVGAVAGLVAIVRRLRTDRAAG
jgi:hypothetical protein